MLLTFLMPHHLHSANASPAPTYHGNRRPRQTPPLQSRHSCARVKSMGEFFESKAWTRRRVSDEMKYATMQCH